jgi:gamma-glutamyltranspeptidase/glutathione hydrolase
MVENEQLSKSGHLSATNIHLTASAMQQAFADRAQYMGDSDFVKVPLKVLTSKSYARDMRNQFASKARPAAAVKAGTVSGRDPLETTHFSMMDAEGNVVSTTQTINGKFGSGVVVPGTGIILNNEMDDFSAKPGAQNMFGAVGGTPNAIAPKKTPLSSMSPTIVLKDGAPVLSLGAPGGTRIITCVTETILNYLEYKMPLYESVSSIRYHQQWMPDVLTIEAPGVENGTIDELKSLGYAVKVDAVPCKVMAVAREGALLRGVADPRDNGASLGN